MCWLENREIGLMTAECQTWSFHGLHLLASSFISSPVSCQYCSWVSGPYCLRLQALFWFLHTKYRPIFESPGVPFHHLDLSLSVNKMNPPFINRSSREMNVPFATATHFLLNSWFWMAPSPVSRWWCCCSGVIVFFHRSSHRHRHKNIFFWTNPPCTVWDMCCFLV